MAKPTYNIDYDSPAALTKTQLKVVLSRLPLDIKIANGHDLPLEAMVIESSEEPILLAEHYANLIVLRPEPGKRLADASFTSNKEAFTPSRIMDECTGGGACCSYHFNTWSLGLDYTIGLTLDIHKLG